MAFVDSAPSIEYNKTFVKAQNHHSCKADGEKCCCAIETFSKDVLIHASFIVITSPTNESFRSGAFDEQINGETGQRDVLNHATSQPKDKFCRDILFDFVFF